MARSSEAPGKGESGVRSQRLIGFRVATRQRSDLSRNVARRISPTSAYSRLFSRRSSFGWSMALADGPREIYRASNDAQDMNDYVLDRGLEQQQGPEAWAEARVPGPERDLDGWLLAAGPAIPETPRRSPVALPVLSDESGGARNPRAEPIVAVRSPVRESCASLTDRLAERQFPSGRFQRFPK